MPDSVWRDLLTTGRQIGRRHGTLRVIEFADFQCTYCAEIQPDIARLRELEDFTLIFRHFPITTSHPMAFDAALAAECAGEVGAFADYHDLLYAKQDSIGLLTWTTMARRAGVSDTLDFKRCLDDAEIEGRIRRDMAVAEEIGIQGTPTFIFAGRIVEGTDNFRALSVQIEQAQDSIARLQERVERQEEVVN